MGRPNKNKKRQGGQHQKQAQQRPKKKQKRERFWIEDCREASSSLLSSNEKQASLEVLITQVQLFDDYRQVPQQQPENNEVQSKEAATVTREDLNDNSVSGKDGEAKPKEILTGSQKQEQEQDDENTHEVVKEKDDERDSSNAKDGTKGTNSPVASLHNPRKDSANESHPEKNSEEKSKPVPDESRQHEQGVNNAEEDTKGGSTDGLDFRDAFISIKRSKSAKKPTRVTADSVEHFKPLPNGDCGDGVVNPYDDKEVPDKFWSQRRRLFTLFDHGIQLDKESWYSVTPEAIANHISAHLVSNRENAIVLDPFCGCGGNAIAFARMDEVKLVVCIDKDIEKLKMAASNAAIYNVPAKKMVFVHDNAARILSLYENKGLTGKSVGGDYTENQERSEEFRIGGTELLPKAIDCIFLSPPWGGIDYGKVGKRNYTLECISVDGTERNTQIGGEEILKRAAKAMGRDGPIALFLPRNTNGVALGRSVLRAGYDSPMVMEKNVLNGKLKTITAYIGL